MGLGSGSGSGGRLAWGRRVGEAERLVSGESAELE